jgi:pimeloyl-ACP methyl ester carboxylesterase
VPKGPSPTWPPREHLEFGDPGGFPILYCHGTPGSAVECTFVDAAARRYALRLIAPDRPGYGWANPALDLSHAQWGRNAAQFLAHLGIERYGVLGVSGGGPNALALAAAEANRIAALTLVCALGPFTEPELAQSASAFARWMLGRARRHLNALDWMALRPLAAIGRALPLAAVAFMRLYNSPTDRPTLSQPEIKRLLARNLVRAFRQGSAGVKRDLCLMLKPWDFPLADVTVGVKLWHGLDDALLLPDHSRWLARHLPHAELQLIEGEGHFSLPIGHADMILRELAERCRRNR